eukprot:TRINITY_DN1606_c0_g1_i1.p1 TRINITY_DN1606_c0_g1~~TRINITY_DN1606_c0_g1_i1.p1  ORF type:complete len:433 (-),score=160.35 TRINITY_DN1606_c0_g1_i1:355-1653(-)
MAKTEAAAAAMSKRASATRKKGKEELKKNALIGVSAFVMLAAVYLGLTDGSGKKTSTSRLASYVNDGYFISDITSYAGGNFTAAGAPIFKSFTYNDVAYGLDGVVLQGEGMIGMAGALQRCNDDDGLEGGAMPSNYDLRELMPGCITPVYNSGNCSSSYATAGATAISMRFCFSDQEKYAGLQLSAQQVLSCDKKSKGCNGGGYDSVFGYIKRRGLFPEECVPFAGGAEAACKSDCDQSKKMKALDHCLISGEKAIKREVFNRGPIVATVMLKDDFLVYSGGIYTPTENAHQQYGANGAPIQHAVTIVGWGVSEGTRYWIVKNNWGKEWGEEGFAKIVVGTVLREDIAVVGHAATEEAVAAFEKKAAAEEARRAELKKEREERDARIAEKQRERAAEKAAQDNDDDLDFEEEDAKNAEDTEEKPAGEEATAE